MNYKEAVARFGKEAIAIDLHIWWTFKSNEERFKIMADYLYEQQRKKRLNKKEKEVKD